MTRGIWDRETVALLMIASLLPLSVFWVLYAGPPALFRFGLSLLVVAAWNLLFLLSRAQVPSFAFVITALAVAMLAPEDLGTFQLVLGISFGVVFGELVFGGWGRNIVNPATVAVSFIGFGFPGHIWPEFDAPVLWATIPALLIGGVTGILPFGVLAGAALICLASFVAGAISAPAISGLVLVFVLLVLDPVTCATTTLGRWLNGAVFAGLVTLFAFGWPGAAPVQYGVAAALLSNLAAPLLDEIALAIWITLRRRRHGKS